jgi:hypothetical protein
VDQSHTSDETITESMQGTPESEGNWQDDITVRSPHVLANKAHDEPWKPGQWQENPIVDQLGATNKEIAELLQDESNST